MPSLSATAATETSVGRAIGFALAAYASFSTSDAIIKVSSGRFPVFEISFFLGLFAFVPILLLTRGRGGLHAMLPRRWGLVALRGVLGTACALLAWRAFAILPLADGYAILFAGPILVTGLSILILGETVGWRRWLSAIVGFGGVMIMLRPGFVTLGEGHLLAAMAAVIGAFSFIVLRKIGPHETSASIMTVLFGTLVLVSAPIALIGFVLPTPVELMMLALGGLLQGGGQTMLVLATREAPVTLVAPFQYTQMVWATAYGALLFHDRPTPVLLVGMAVVVGSGLYTLWRETVRRAPSLTMPARGEVIARAAR